MADRPQQGLLRREIAGQQIGPLVVAGDEDNRFSGGKSAAVATVTAAGSTTVLTPATGKAIRLFWLSAITDPDEANSPLIKVLLGANELYRAYAISHWELFTGAVNASLTVDLSSAASVAVTAHYTEV